MTKKPYEDLEELLNRLDKKKTLNIFMHNSPDPDGMGSALLLKKIASKYEQPSKIYYSKECNFLMNRYAITTLDLPFTRLKTLESPEKLIAKMDYVALVDVATADKVSYYDLLEDKIVIDIDHHPNGDHKWPADRFVHRKKSGACISFLIDWTRQMGIELDADEDKALILTSYLGLKTDTMGFSEKGMEKVDREAKEYIEKLITPEGFRIMKSIESAPTPLSWSKKLGEVLQGLPKTKVGVTDTFYKGVGVIDDAGIVPYIAEHIFSTQNFKTVIIYGLHYNLADSKKYDELAIRASGRSSDNSIKLSEAFSDIFYKVEESGDRTHTGGGRKTKLASAGADIPLPEESELDITDLEKLYGLWEAKIQKRIENILKIQGE